MQATADPEGAILRLVRSLERGQPTRQLAPLVSLGSLARQLGLGRARCREAVHELVRRGELEVMLHPRGFLRLWTTL